MAVTEQEFKDFVRGYIGCALWSEMDNSDPNTGGDPLDKNYGPDDLSDDARAEIESECWGFVMLNAHLIDELPRRSPDGDTRYAYAGYLFWLNRNHHGSGFWDHREIPEDARDRLDSSSHDAGERDIYVGDDGKLHYTFG